MKDLRSPEVRAADEAEWKQRQADRARRAAELEATLAAMWTAPPPWQPIETCPFEALSEAYGIDGAILVTDGAKRALVSVHERFGRPVLCVRPPELAITDEGGPVWIGGEYKEFDRPDWWFKWELTDEFGRMTYAGGEPTGKEEIDFVPTHWISLRLPPPISVPTPEKQYDFGQGRWRA